MQQNFKSVSATAPGILATNKVIRNTYMLLAMTILFSAFTAVISMYTGLIIHPAIGILGMLGLLFLTQATANSAMGLVSTFLFTGFMGLILGPTIDMYIQGYSNGSEIVSAALASTGAIFFALSGYAMTTRKDFSYMGGFLFVGTVVVFLALLANLFFQIPALELVLGSAIVLLMSGYILFETSQIINGGQRNYILATISLYVSLFNIFVWLLRIFSMLAGRRD